MKSWKAILFALVASGCASSARCPTIDERVLARQVVDSMLGIDPPPRDDEVEPDEDADDDESGQDRGGGQRGSRGGDVEPGSLESVPFHRLPHRGPETARVRVIVASDFQCPYCSRYAATIDRLVEARSDVAVYFVNLPLPFHSNAHVAAEAALEAREQGGDAAFFRMHDAMFAAQNALGPDDLVRYAVQIGLDGGAMRAALQDHRHAADVDAHADLADRLGATGTPSTFVGDEILQGAVPYGTLLAAVERASP